MSQMAASFVMRLPARSAPSDSVATIYEPTGMIRRRISGTIDSLAALHGIRRVNLSTGMIETFAGTGERQPTPDGAPLTGTPLNGPRTIAFDRDGTLYLALREGNAIVRINPKTRTIHHVAGTGDAGYTGDGGPARSAKLGGPKGLAYSPGQLYVADTENHVIRRIDLKTGIISTVLGTGTRGDGPETDPRQCKLSRPHGVFVDRSGVLYVADSEAHRIRVVNNLA